MNLLLIKRLYNTGFVILVTGGILSGTEARSLQSTDQSTTLESATVGPSEACLDLYNAMIEADKERRNVVEQSDRAFNSHNYRLFLILAELVEKYTKIYEAALAAYYECDFGSKATQNSGTNPSVD